MTLLSLLPLPSLRRFLPGLALSCMAASLVAQTKPAPPTPAQTALWMAQGRTLPEPELLQPRLDPGLPDFVPSLDPSMAAHLKGASSDVLAVLTKNWAAAFRHYYPNIAIDVPPPYAGSLGALELIKGDLDFVAVSRELKPSDISSFRKKFGYDPLSTPVSGGTYRHFGFLDSIVVFVNQDNPIGHLTFGQLDRVLSSTHLRGGEAITTWGQLGLTGDWADKPVHAWGVKPWNGFEEFVRERVLSTTGGRGEWRADLNFTDTVFPISPHVAEDRYAIGYAGLAYVGPGVKLLALSPDDGGDFVEPSYENVALATYPLSRLVYINLNKAPDQPLNPVVREFVRFVLSRQGQQVILDEAIYVPLRASQVERSLSLIN
jgi:phosphate transport system substrate-binding protein